MGLALDVIELGVVFRLDLSYYILHTHIHTHTHTHTHTHIYIYIYIFLNTLIENLYNVKELRSKYILLNNVGSDKREVLMPHTSAQLCAQLAHVASCAQSCALVCGTRIFRDKKVGKMLKSPYGGGMILTLTKMLEKLLKNTITLR